MPKYYNKNTGQVMNHSNDYYDAVKDQGNWIPYENQDIEKKQVKKKAKKKVK